MPTARNARGIDIVAYPSDVNAGRYVGIQVKTLSKPQDVGMSKEGLRHNGTIWFVVVLNEGKGEELTVYCFGDDILEAGTKAENKPVVIETSNHSALISSSLTWNWSSGSDAISLLVKDTMYFVLIALYASFASISFAPNRPLNK